MNAYLPNGSVEPDDIHKPVAHVVLLLKFKSFICKEMKCCK